MPIKLPVKVTRIPSGYCVTDSAKVSLAYFYVHQPTHPSDIRLPSDEEGKELAQRFARMLTDEGT